jgi:hypothetical protein
MSWKDRDLNHGRGKSYFSSSWNLDQFRSQNVFLFNVTVSFHGDKSFGIGINTTPPSSAEFKQQWKFASSPPNRIYDVDMDTLL